MGTLTNQKTNEIISALRAYHKNKQIKAGLTYIEEEYSKHNAPFSLIEPYVLALTICAQYPKAIDVLQKAIEKYPKTEDLYLKLANVCIRGAGYGRISYCDAKKEIEELQRIAIRLSNPYDVLHSLEFKQKELDFLFEDFESVITSFQSDINSIAGGWKSNSGRIALYAAALVASRPNVDVREEMLAFWNDLSDRVSPTVVPKIMQHCRGYLTHPHRRLNRLFSHPTV